MHAVISVVAGVGFIHAREWGGYSSH